MRRWSTSYHWITLAVHTIIPVMCVTMYFFHADLERLQLHTDVKVASSLITWDPNSASDESICFWKPDTTGVAHRCSYGYSLHLCVWWSISFFLRKLQIHFFNSMEVLRCIYIYFFSCFLTASESKHPFSRFACTDPYHSWWVTITI